MLLPVRFPIVALSAICAVAKVRPKLDAVVAIAIVAINPMKSIDFISMKSYREAIYKHISGNAVYAKQLKRRLHRNIAEALSVT
jgi:hypothetical protein